MSKQESAVRVPRGVGMLVFQRDFEMAAESWGLAAYARSGQVELELDESDSEPATYMLSMTFPSVQLCFAIAGLGIAETLRRFVSEYYGRSTFAEISMGRLGNLEVLLIKDDEYPDRFFLRAVGPEGLVDVSVIDPIAGDFVRVATELAASAAR